LLFLYGLASDAFIGCKLKQMSFVLVSISKKQIRFDLFRFLVQKKIGLICFGIEFKKTNPFDLF
jgi:hypothetical protein